jgi:long-chain-fatty-acid--[acyl-carrier-protein] ligase
MPNHTAFVDPPIVEAFLHHWYPRSIRPIVESRSYRDPMLYPIMLLIDALEVPDLTRHSGSAVKKTYEMIDRVVDEVNRGESFLLYPAGRFQTIGKEVIGSTRTPAEILSRAEKVNVALVRIRGLWGSRLGCARTGESPSLTKQAIISVGILLANLVFFLPRRKVTLTVEIVPPESLPELDRKTLNPWLEAWYNADLDGLEKPIYVPYHWFGPRHFSFAVEQEQEVAETAEIPAELRAEVNEMVEDYLDRKLTPDEDRPDITLDQLGMDSLDRMDLALEIERRYSFRSSRVGKKLGDIWALAAGLAGPEEEDETPPPAEWTAPRDKKNTVEVLGDAIPEAFMRRMLQNGNEAAVVDELAGLLSYRKLLTGCLLFRKRFEKLDAERVGVMLPSSVAADITFFGLQLTGKLPVMMNWTTGPANMAHAVRTLGLKQIVTSKQFVDRLQIELEGVEFIYLEEVKKGIGKLEALKALASTYLAPGRLRRSVPTPDADSPAVILFTSGSDAAPKVVPLSHRNLLANITATYPKVDVDQNDIVFSFLPMFHSFGLTLATTLPLLIGIRVVHHPDPTDSRALLRLSRKYRPTCALSTPTLLSYMFEGGQSEDFESYRFFMIGAEKVPEPLFERAQEISPKTIVLEGYGITECSPLVSANLSGAIKRGSMGRPLANVEMLVVDPDTYEPLPQGETGMLLVRGPSIFGGYLNHDGPSPFVEVDGQSWYKTGDLVMLDDDGFYQFRGRLKRFLKVGGEMISLPAMEEPFTSRYPTDESGPRVAVEGIDRDGQRRIVLFTTFDLSMKEASAILTEAGFHGIMRLDAVERIDQIPLLGTGKIDYKLLRKRVEQM